MTGPLDPAGPGAAPARPAPPTMRDRPGTPAPATPATTRDAGPTATTRDAGPATTRDACPPATTLDRPGRETPGPAHRVNLPPALDRSFELDRVLGSGGEADLLLARQRDSGQQVVVRRYRETRGPLDQNLLRQLRDADRTHLIGILDWGEDADARWEILEYAPFGSLADLVKAEPAPWPADRVEQAVRQLAAALDYAHSLNLVHRDVKPENILVRSRLPMDLVLTDFGLTRVVMASEVQATTSRTSAYAAPEAASGAVSRSVDWWSLGIVTVELLTGHHPFRRPDGTWLDDMQILKHHLSSRHIPLDDITDERWRDLSGGLLTADPRHRWAGRQVAQWLSGQRPPVHQPPATDAGATAADATRSDRPFIFRNAPLYAPAEVAAAFRENWADAARLIRGREMSAPGYLALRDWVAERELRRAEQVLDRPGPPDRVLAQLVTVLDPVAEPSYRGWPVSPAGLVALLGAAATRPDAAAAVESMCDQGILDAYDGAPGCDGLGLLNDRWRGLVETYEQRIPPQFQQLVPPDRRQLAKIRLLAAAIAPDRPSPAAADAALARTDQQALQQHWFRELAGMPPAAQNQPAADEVVVQLRDIAADQTAQWQAGQAAIRAQAEQQRRLASQHRLDRASTIISLLLGLFSVPPVGIVTGPAAIYFNVRARRGGAGGCIANIGLLLGLFGTIGSLVYLSQL